MSSPDRVAVRFDRRRPTISIAVGVLTALALAVPLTANGALKPSWKCVAAICLGQSRASIVYRYGGIVDDTPSRVIQVPGGKVRACFWRCQGWVTEDGFSYYGGSLKPDNRVLGLETQDPTFRLPDGVRLGTYIPFGKRWNGYHAITLGEPGPRPGWEKTVRVGTTRIRVVLDVTQGRVEMIDLEIARPTAASNSASTKKIVVLPTSWGADPTLAAQHPRSILASANGALVYVDLAWSGWGKKVAVAKGIEARNNCEPSCAQGTTAKTPVTITASSIGQCRGRTYYLSITIRGVNGTAHGRVRPVGEGCSPF
jgi:hypothetical protein